MQQNNNKDLRTILYHSGNFHVWYFHPTTLFAHSYFLYTPKQFRQKFNPRPIAENHPDPVTRFMAASLI